MLRILPDAAVSHGHCSTWDRWACVTVTVDVDVTQHPMFSSYLAPPAFSDHLWDVVCEICLCYFLPGRAISVFPVLFPVETPASHFCLLILSQGFSLCLSSGPQHRPRCYPQAHCLAGMTHVLYAVFLGTALPLPSRLTKHSPSPVPHCISNTKRPLEGRHSGHVAKHAVSWIVGGQEGPWGSLFSSSALQVPASLVHFL